MHICAQCETLIPKNGRRVETEDGVFCENGKCHRAFYADPTKPKKRPQLPNIFDKKFEGPQWFRKTLV